MAKNDLQITTGRSRKSVTDKTAVGSAAQKAANGRGQQARASEEEQAKRRSEGRTQGRAGCRMGRLNMAFSPENEAYLQALKEATGYNKTKLVNSIIDKYREDYADILPRLRELKKARQKFEDLRQALDADGYGAAARKNGK